MMLLLPETLSVRLNALQIYALLINCAKLALPIIREKTKFLIFVQTITICSEIFLRQ